MRILFQFKILKQKQISDFTLIFKDKMVLLQGINLGDILHFKCQLNRTVDQYSILKGEKVRGGGCIFPFQNVSR